MAQLPVGSIANDRVMAALVSGLECEFGRGAGTALAHRFLEAERVEFHWEARIAERWIGTYPGLGEDGLELDRVRVLGRLEGRWFVAVMIVDGEGNAHGIIAKRSFARAKAARQAFADA